MKKILILISLLTTQIASAESFRLATWNIQRGKYFNRIVKEMDKKALGKSEIILFQEMTDPKQLDQLAEKYGYHKIGETRDTVLSKFPILESGKVVVNIETGRSATWATLQLKTIKLRIYNVHFSYKVDKNPVVPKIRAQEAKACVDHARGFVGPVVIAGDMNTVLGPKLEPLINVLKNDGYVDALARKPIYTQLAGRFFPMGRIDWIFSKYLIVEGAVAGRFAGSDHRWMQSTLSW